MEGCSTQSIVINGIPYPSNNLVVTIGDNIDFSINGDTDVRYLSVDGLNVDTGYIQSLVDTQYFTPTSEDFGQVFSNLIPYMKILVFMVFIFFVYKLLKKSF